MQNDVELNELMTFFQNGQRIKYLKSEIIIRAGEIPRGVYYIESGIIKVYALSRHNDQHIHHFFGPGDFFPMTWVFQDLPRNLYFECLEPVEVLMVPKENFSKFILGNDKVLHEMLEEIVLRYIRYAGRIENLLYSNSMERCAYRLLSIANSFGIQSDDGLEIKASITHEDMARSVNMTRETFSRALARLHVKNLISYDKNRHLVIKDVEALVKVIGKDEVNAMWPNLEKYLI